MELTYCEKRFIYSLSSRNRININARTIYYIALKR